MEDEKQYEAMEEELVRRDMFAAAALSGMLADPGELASPHEVAQAAYAYAKAMENERPGWKDLEDEDGLEEAEIDRAFGRTDSATDEIKRLREQIAFLENKLDETHTNRCYFCEETVTGETSRRQAKTLEEAASDASDSQLSPPAFALRSRLALAFIRAGWSTPTGTAITLPDGTVATSQSTERAQYVRTGAAEDFVSETRGKHLEWAKEILRVFVAQEQNTHGPGSKYENAILEAKDFLKRIR